MSAADLIKRPDNPSDVLDDDTMNVDEKEKYLESWRLDIIERMRATEENMMSDSRESGDLSELLQRVNTALSKVRGT